MKKIETIAQGKNYAAATIDKLSEIIEHELPMGPDFTLQGKVFWWTSCRRSRRRILLPNPRSWPGQWIPPHS